MKKVNEEIIAGVIVLNANGEPATGATVTAEVFDEGYLSFSEPTVSEIGATGVFYASFTPDAEGLWTILFDCASPNMTRSYSWYVQEQLADDIDSILADTNELQTDWHDGGRLDLLIDGIKAVTDALPDSGALTTIDTNIDDIETDTNEIQTDLTDGGRLDLLIDAIKAETDTIDWTDITAIKTETDQLPNWLFDSKKYATTVTVDAEASAAEQDLTAGSAVVTIPTGATIQGVTLAAFLHVANKSAATHKIGLTLQIQKAAEGYGDVVDLTANPPVSLVNVDGAMATFAIACDVSGTVDGAATYTFKWQVDSDNAGAVNYTSNFVLAITYSM